MEDFLGVQILHGHRDLDEPLKQQTTSQCAKTITMRTRNRFNERQCEYLHDLLLRKILLVLKRKHRRCQCDYRVWRWLDEIQPAERRGLTFLCCMMRSSRVPPSQ